MTDPTTPELRIVAAWLGAVNDRDADRLLDLSSDDIAIIGPRGRSTGHDVLRTWLASAGITLTSLRHFQKDDIIVVEQHATWHAQPVVTNDGQTTLATRFRVRSGQVAEIERFESLVTALAAAGLSNADEIAN